MSIDFRIGDTRDLTAAIPDGSISLVASSPPFLALRSYLPAGHADKHNEIGSEPDPATFLDTLLALTAEWGRVLAPWGSIAIELGDTYSGAVSTGGSDYTDGGQRDADREGNRKTVKYTNAQYGGRNSIPGNRNSGISKGPGWPRAKSLALIPQLYACSLAYGRNILTGAPSPAGPWLVRNIVVWHRPNPAVGALGDKYRPSTSYIVVATRSAKRWFDLTAVRTPYQESTLKQHRGGDTINGDKLGYGAAFSMAKLTHAGAPPLDTWTDEHDYHDTWTITTQPSKIAHYAMWPPRLAERLILSMCPLAVCSVCGEPRRRVEGTAEYTQTRNGSTPAVLDMREGESVGFGVRNWSANGAAKGDNGVTRQAPTLGWTDCGHDAYVPGTILDPFAGTGTTCCVAELHGRNSIGIDLDPRNAELVDARMVECKRALFGTIPEMVGQLGLAL